MPAPPPDARSLLAEVTRIEPVGEDAVLLVCRPEEPIPPVRASRFFMLRREDGASPLIPRPYSIYLQEGEELLFLIQVLGRGSRALVETPRGGTLRLIGPLGNGWPTIDGEGDPWVMLAGGVGCAPFPLAIRQALSGMDGAAPVPPESIAFLFGAASAGRLYDLESYLELGVRVATATVDGSSGFRGNVLELLAQQVERGELPERARLLACGPERMLEAVSDHARARELDCWLSLETLMGCGVGICNGCPVPTDPQGALGDWPNAKCCVEGPVFAARDLAALA